MKLLLSLLIFLFPILTQAQSFSEYTLKEFEFQGHQAKVVFPNTEMNGEWIWRARFWGHEPQLDKALLEKGFHLVYVDVAGLYGNEEAVQLWDDFYKFIRKEYRLKKKVVLEGMSRGGLIVYNWAAKNPKKVACIYADAPVCDIKSWPGGLYESPGSSADWEQCLKAYGLDENTIEDFTGSPIDNYLPIVKAKIPLIHVCGLDDKVVPYEENTGLLAERIRASGGEILLILKEGIGHHPHSLPDPQQLRDFILDQLQ